MEDEQIISCISIAMSVRLRKLRTNTGVGYLIRHWVFWVISEMRRSARMKHIIRRGDGLRTGACVIYGHTL